MDLDASEKSFYGSLDDIETYIDFEIEPDAATNEINSYSDAMCDDCQFHLEAISNDVHNAIVKLKESLIKSMNDIVSELRHQYDKLWSHCHDVKYDAEHFEEERKELEEENKDLKKEIVEINHALAAIGEKRNISVEQVKEIIDDLYRDDLFARYLKLEI